jgi:hypothetical protein
MPLGIGGLTMPFGAPGAQGRRSSDHIRRRPDAVQVEVLSAQAAFLAASLK